LCRVFTRRAGWCAICVDADAPVAGDRRPPLSSIRERLRVVQTRLEFADRVDDLRGLFPPRPALRTLMQGLRTPRGSPPVPAGGLPIPTPGDSAGIPLLPMPPHPAPPPSPSRSLRRVLLAQPVCYAKALQIDAVKPLQKVGKTVGDEVHVRHVRRDTVGFLLVIPEVHLAEFATGGPNAQEIPAWIVCDG
jgi:hypothetical protein